MEIDRHREYVTWLERFSSKFLKEKYQDIEGPKRDVCEQIERQLRRSHGALGSLISEGFESHYHQDIFLFEWKVQRVANHQSLAASIENIPTRQSSNRSFSFEFLGAIKDTVKLLADDPSEEGAIKADEVHHRRPVRILIKQDLLVVQVLTFESQTGTFSYLASEKVIKVLDRDRPDAIAYEAMGEVCRSAQAAYCRPLNVMDGMRRICGSTDIDTFTGKISDNGRVTSSYDTIGQNTGTRRGLREAHPAKFREFLDGHELLEATIRVKNRAFGLDSGVGVRIYPARGHVKCPQQLNGSNILTFIEALV